MYRRFTFWKAVLLVILPAGLVAMAYRFTHGLGASTALTDAFPWGLWVGFKLFAVALAGGGFTLAAVVYIFNIERYRPVLRPMVLTAFLGYSMFIISLIIDLGRPYRVWHPVVMWNPHSVMFEIAWCVMLYTTVLFLEFIPVVLERLGWRRPLRWVELETRLRWFRWLRFFRARLRRRNQRRKTMNSFCARRRNRWVRFAATQAWLP